MPLETGRQLGPYEIVSAIGAGGMGEVYKARDTRLDRTVAIKVLPEHVASDPDLKQRFEREAKTISSLNHPHICTLYDIGNQNGIDFLVMEYLKGDTLAQRLEKGALPIDQALKIAVEIADALDKAHRQGITHRDLKPGNIMLTKAGAKLLDFGLAKLKPDHDAPVGVSAPTVSAGLTGEGAILGTLQYMVPEQLEGKEADARTDIFAFGALVYEMVTGRRAFSGDSQASLIAAILDREPVPMSTLHAMTPARLDEIVKTCLAKDPEDRWQSARDVGRLLKEPIGGATQATDPVAAAAGPELHVWQRPIPLVLGIVTTVVATSLVVWSLAPHSSPEVGRFLLTSPESAPLAIRQSPSVALTPDGSRLVYVGERSGSRFGLFVRAMDGFETTLLYEEVTDRPFSPFVSPDGRWVGFSRSDSQTLMRVPVLGGPPETICECDSLTGGVWGADDTIIFGREVAAGGGLWRVVAGGGDPEPLTSPDMGAGERVHLEPEIMPGGMMVLFTIMSDDPNENPQIALLDLDTRDYQLLFPGRRPRYVSTGHIVYSVNGVLWAVGFNLARIAVIGEPTLVLDDTSPSGGSALFAVSQNGSLVYVAGKGTNSRRTLVWVDRRGRREEFNLPEAGCFSPRLSHDGTRVAYHLANGGRVLVHDLERGTTTMVSTDPGLADFRHIPSWTPDDERIVFTDGITGPRRLVSMAADGVGRAEPLPIDAMPQLRANAFGPDGTLLFDYASPEPGEGQNIGVLWADGRHWEPLLDGPANERLATLSPDGRWVAYSSDETGRPEVYVRRFPELDRREVISRGGGVAPVWSPVGNEIFYLVAPETTPTISGRTVASGLISVPVEPGLTLEVGEPTLLFEDVDVIDVRLRDYDVAPDAQHFLMVSLTSDATRDVVLVQNWFDELQRLMPSP